MAEAEDLRFNLSASLETMDAEAIKFGGPCKMATPSQAEKSEGVET